MFLMSKQYLANIALKINKKVGGRNTVLVAHLACESRPVMGRSYDFGQVTCSEQFSLPSMIFDATVGR